jgi:lipopolysaccharide export system protein LptA
MKLKKQFILFFLLSLISVSLFSQQRRMIELLNADELIFQKLPSGEEYKRLLGNVKFKHEDEIMTCDSAWFFSDRNTMEAFSNVHIKQGDSLDLYADYLNYDGNKRISHVRHHIRLIHNKAILYTDSLNYYRNENLAKYYGTGRLEHGEDTLTSEYGYYYSVSQNFIPVKNVVMHNPRFTMFTDSGFYNSGENKAYFVSPTKFVTDSAIGYCSAGWYEVPNDYIYLGKQSRIEGRKAVLTGDSLFYDMKKDEGWGYRNTVLNDTVRKIMIKGNHIYYSGKLKQGIATDSAVFVQIDDQKDSLFLHADSLLLSQDTTKQRILRAYHHVRFYKSTMQGKCDSLVSLSDTLTILYGAPILWSEERQISAPLIKLYSDSGVVKRMELYDGSFIVDRQDSGKFNQIKGIDMVAYFKNDAIEVVDVTSHSESIYYMLDGDTYKGVNKVASKNMRLYFDDGKVKKVVYRNKPSGTFYSMETFPFKQAYLAGFNYQIKLRPIDKFDIFRQ